MLANEPYAKLFRSLSTGSRETEVPILRMLSSDRFKSRLRLRLIISFRLREQVS